ncbi:hypothetical protein F3Y22_tig00015251pilonHSYRG00004 [Hibiscus syriacus]|uniref:Cullin N-terminal domain-containing protein n=1 Tax=Hibiscus syriacus TaxID=106335 RepID=A0A6A3BYH4_HIBSY|nr:hypothetical protein F3Y22_tig00015251pilonHSYRG00004 [Hibiscus syriacus]
MLGICLAVMLGLAFSSSGSSLILHVYFLVLIVVALFLLLNWFLEQTGLVSIEHKMQEMDLIAKDHVIKHKANHFGDTPIISSSSLPSPYVCSSRTQLGVGSDGLSVTLGIDAATGLGLLDFSEVETTLQLVGSAAIIHLLSKKLLFAEDLWLALYLDRTYVKQNPNVRSLWDMGLQLFHKHLSLAPEVEHKTVTGLLRMIESERLGEAVDRTLLNHLLKIFTALGIYSESFEKPFLECTSEFYAAERIKYMQ